MQKAKKISILIIGAVFLITPKASFGFTFDKNLLITDKELTNQEISLKGIKGFLQEKGSILANYQTKDIDNKEKSVAEIIYNVSTKYKLNPMLFTVMAQKESSAITSKRMTYAIKNWLLGFGRCDSCSEAQAAPYRGIAKQLHSAAEKFTNGYLHDLNTKGTTISGWGVGITKTTIDGINVTPQNKATATLYTYNPCVGAYGGGYKKFGCNSAFQKLWQQWNPATTYPNGSLLNINGVVYLIQNNKKRAFTSRSALVANYNLKNIIAVPSIVGEKYENGNNITFPNYSLLRNPSGTIYLLVDGKKRGITSQETFKQLGFHKEEIIDTKWKEINNIPEGEKITSKIQYPAGTLIQNSDTGAIVYIDSGNRKHDIYAPEILKNRFPGKNIIAKNSSFINQFKKGKPVKLKDGTLVTSKKSKSIFVISDGKRYPFKSAKVFKKLGYKWKNIITVPQNILELHPKKRYIKL